MYIYVVLTILAGFCYSLMSVFIKMAYEYSNEPTITFFRFFSALAMLLPLYFISGKPTLRTKVPILHGVRGFFGFLMFTLYTISLQYIPLENALALNSTYPLFIPLLLYIFSKEHISFIAIVGIFIGFLGVYIIINPSTNQYISWASILAVLSAFCSAISNITVSTLRKTESSFSIVFYFFAAATVISLIYMMFNEIIFSNEAAILMFGIAITSLASQQLISYVLKYLHPNVVSSLMYSSIVFGFIFSWIFWNRTPSMIQILGSLVIVIGLMILKKSNLQLTPVSNDKLN